MVLCILECALKLFTNHITPNVLKTYSDYEWHLCHNFKCHRKRISLGKFVKFKLKLKLKTYSNALTAMVNLHRPHRMVDIDAQSNVVRLNHLQLVDQCLNLFRYDRSLFELSPLIGGIHVFFCICFYVPCATVQSID